jgi:succinate-acetate transporter protein
MTHTDETPPQQPPGPPPPRGVLVGAGGDPLIVGLIFFGIASLVLGVALIGIIPATLGGIVPILVVGAGLFQLLTTLWAIYLAQSMVAAIFSTFSAFWLSLSALLLGLDHGWYAIPPEQAAYAKGLFFIGWACLFFFLTIPCLRLPITYNLAVALVCVATALAAAGSFTGSAGVLTAAGAVALTFSFLAFYGWTNVALTAAGGTPFPPLGKPLL